MFCLLNRVLKPSLFFLLLFCSAMETHYAQSENPSAVRGQITIKGSETPLYAATVSIVQLGRSTMTDEEGRYEFRNVPPGFYDISSHMHAFTGEMEKIEVVAGKDVIADLELSLSPVKIEVTVTASGREVSAFDAFQSVTTLDSLKLSEKSSFALGDVVGEESGVHKRSFGPGSSRPVVRGFDGDRVLILSDGLSTGTLSAQSGEHAEPVDAVGLDRIEIVKGPATLLYGSNAIGGVVNMVSAHHMLHENPHPGVRGQLTAIVGTNNKQASGHLNVEYGHKNWLFWGSGSRQVTSDYWSPEGRVDNSYTKMTSGSVGLGWFGSRPFFNLGYAFNNGRLGIPFAGEFHHHHHEEEEEEHDHGDHEEGEEEHDNGDHEGEEGEEDHDHEDHEEESLLVDETFTQQIVRFNAGVRDLESFFEEFKVSANYSRWMHKELENDMTATSFDNKQFNIRTTFTQRKKKFLNGTSGFQLSLRDYRAEGEEALSPPVTGHGGALFTLQEMDFESVRLQLGGRIDHTAYDPAGMSGRSFTGFSAAAGAHVPLWENTAFVANYTHSYRAPAIEELYNNGPHIGNLLFEIGDPNLKREIADGIDLSIRRQGPLFDAEANFYYYGIRDFVYLNLTGEMEHGLRVAVYSQADARFLGGEAQFSLKLHPNLWVNTGLDIVSAELTDTGTPLPRIPPLRGRFGLDARWRGFSFEPEVVMVSDQDEIYPTETRTAGYTTFEMKATYIFSHAGLMHVFSAALINMGDRLYRNHLSFIKDLAPEMGRNFRFNYSMRFF